MYLLEAVIFSVISRLFFFKQRTAYEMRISDWSSDVCSSDLRLARRALEPGETLVWADRPDPQALARSRLPQVIRGVLGLAVIATFLRSEERRVGRECVSTCRSRGLKDT